MERVIEVEVDLLRQLAAKNCYSFECKKCGSGDKTTIFAQLDESGRPKVSMRLCLDCSNDGVSDFMEESHEQEKSTNW